MLLKDCLNRAKPLFKHVGGASNVRQAISQNIPHDSVCYIVPLSETPMGNSRDVDVGCPVQEVNITIGILIGIKNFNDDTGFKSIELLDAQKIAVRETFYGWKPDDEHDPMLLGKSELVHFSNTGLWWVQRFMTTTWQRGVQPI